MQQFARQVVDSTPDDNNLATSHLGWTETLLKQKSLKYSVSNCNRIVKTTNF